MFSAMDKSVLIIAAHLDDAVIAVGGIIGKLVKNGCQVNVVCFGNGDEAFTVPDGREAAIIKFKKEAEEAYKLLGVRCFIWPYIFRAVKYFDVFIDVPVQRARHIMFKQIVLRPTVFIARRTPAVDIPVHIISCRFRAPKNHVVPVDQIHGKRLMYRLELISALRSNGFLPGFIQR